jgi:hypothetical protein
MRLTSARPGPAQISLVRLAHKRGPAARLRLTKSSRNFRLIGNLALKDQLMLAVVR